MPLVRRNGKLESASWDEALDEAAPDRAFGLDLGLPFPLARVAEADTLLVAGGNPPVTDSAARALPTNVRTAAPRS